MSSVFCFIVESFHSTIKRTIPSLLLINSLLSLPSFGEWGWTIGAKTGKSPLARLNSLQQLPIKHSWLNLDILKAAFIFPNNFYIDEANIDINTLGSHTLYQLHQKAWQTQQGIN
jgi:spermidine synthase